MKKKTFIIPLVCLILSFAGIMSMTFLRTGFLYYYDITRSITPESTVDYISLRKHSELWYKFNPNVNSLSAFVKSHNVINSLYENKGVITENEDFKQEAEYCKKLLDLIQTEKIDDDLDTYSPFLRYSANSDYVNYYVLALYLSGDKDEALDYFENYFKDYANETNEKILLYSIYGCDDFISYVYNNSEDPQEKEKLDKTLELILEQMKAVNNEINIEKLYNDIIAPINY